jgi:hypothetical protein
MRCVGDELALRRHRSLERLEHRVEAAREAAEVVVALGVDAAAQVARARHVIGGIAQLTEWTRRGTRHDQPERGREPDAPEANAAEDPAESIDRGVHLIHRTGNLKRLPVADRARVDPHVDPVDGLVVEEGAHPADGDPSCLGGDGQARAAVRLPQHLAVRIHELRVARRSRERRRRHQLPLHERQFVRRDDLLR